MVDINLINKVYKQKGDVCALASYSIIIEHYSKKEADMQKVFANFIDFFPDLNKKITKVLNKTDSKDRLLMKENLISNEFHSHCRNDHDKRGFDFFVELHNLNSIKTGCYCTVIKSKAQKSTNISKTEVLEIRENLKLGGLAMILYFTTNGGHSIVVGYDKDKKAYFKRDTNTREIEYEDFLESNNICEYIWFSNNDEIIEKHKQ
jgi:hypothetical protein